MKDKMTAMTGSFHKICRFRECRNTRGNLGGFRAIRQRRLHFFTMCLTVFAAALPLSGCQKISHTRVKMTATVETDAGIYTGSSVQKYACRHSLHFMGDAAQCDVKGDAVVVDMKDKGYLFLIFDTPGSHSIMSMPVSVLSVVTDDPLSANNATLPHDWTVPTKNMPLMVKFNDLNDAGSVQSVDPNDLATSFGRGVNSVSVKVETTRDLVATGAVARLLPWLKDKQDHLYDDPSATPFSRTLSQANFTSEYEAI